MKCRIAILVMVFGTVSLTAASQEAADALSLYVVKVKGKYGFIDRSGKTVISPQYDEALEFREGVSAVRLGDKYGFIDSAGDSAIKPQFDDVSFFSEGLAAVEIGKKWGYVDKSGKLVIKAQFDFAGDFAEGLASVSRGETDGFIDRTGKMAFTFHGFEMLGKFSEGLATVTVLGTPKDKTFFVDRTGRKAFPGEFDSAGGFSDGLAIVQRGDKMGYIDKTGKVVIPFKSWSPWGGFSSGLAVVILHGGGAEYIDKTGKEVITGNFARAEPFSEGLAAVQLKVGQDVATRTETKTSIMMMFKAGVKYGYIDETGSLVIPAQFESADKFVNGLARVCLESSEKLPIGIPDPNKQPCGYIDKTGKMIWQPTY